MPLHAHTLGLCDNLGIIDSIDAGTAAYEYDLSSDDSADNDASDALIENHDELDNYGLHEASPLLTQSQDRSLYNERLTGEGGSKIDGTDLEDTTDSASENSTSSGTDGAEEIPSRHEVVSKARFTEILKNKEYQNDLSLLYPESLWREPDGPITASESTSFDENLLSQLLEQDAPELELHGFCIYNGLDHNHFPGQYVSLHSVAMFNGRGGHLLDGIVSYAGQNITLCGDKVLKFRLNPNISIQTEESSKFNGWLRLKGPVTPYERIWIDSLWVVDFAMYCIRYFELVRQSEQEVTLDCFQSSFFNVLDQEYQQSSSFRTWAQRGGTGHDMRRHLTMHGPFVYRRCQSSDLLGRFEKHAVWDEIMCGVRRKKFDDKEKTVVTPDVASTFLEVFHMWGPDHFNLLEAHNCKPAIQASRKERLHSLCFPAKLAASQQQNFRVRHGVKESKVEWTLREAREQDCAVDCHPQELSGRLVVIRQQTRKGKHFDFALVTKVAKNNKHVRIVWMTIPSNAFCKMVKDDAIFRRSEHQGAAFYPVGNELFFSDDCNCFSVTIEDIIGVYNINILDDYKGDPCEFFALLQYREKDQCIAEITRSQLDFTCQPFCTRSAKDMKCRRRCSSSQASSSSNPASPLPPTSARLPNYSLFSGMGHFDRGLEEAGQIHTVYSVDSDSFAIRSARANANKDTSIREAEFIEASVNVELKKFMTGERTYPELGCLSAGTPCPGFSNANSKKKTIKSQRECSLLALTLSWVDVLLPLYVAIENVPAMDSGSPNACKQAIYWLIARGYQVRKLVLKASDYGGCTSRKRLFILACAPGHHLPDSPERTHGDDKPGDLIPSFTIKHAISSLPRVHNDTLTTVSSPYHIPLVRVPPNTTKPLCPNFREILHLLPTHPQGLGLLDSLHLMPPTVHAWLARQSSQKSRRGSNLLRRIVADGFFRTIVTQPHWVCSYTGQIVHYEQARLMTLEEAARAQGVPDGFVIVGPRAEKLRQVGNAVPWCLGAVIGRGIGDAYRRSGVVGAGAAAGHGEAEVESGPEVEVQQGEAGVVTPAASEPEDGDTMGSSSSEEEHEVALGDHTAGNPTDSLPVWSLARGSTPGLRSGKARGQTGVAGQGEKRRRSSSLSGEEERVCKR